MEGVPNSGIGSHHSSDRAASSIHSSLKLSKASVDSLKSSSSGFAHSVNTSLSNNSQDSSSTSRNDYEPFETFKFKVIQLCRDIGYGEPSEVERIQGGSHNRIIGLKFTSGQNQNCVLRIPVDNLDERGAIEIGNQAAVLLHFARYDFLHAPAVLGYDLTKDNAIESQYVLQTRLRGKRMQDVYYKLPLSEKLEIAQLVAELLIKMESMSLAKPGRLIGKQPLPLVSHTPPITDDIEIIGYRENPLRDTPAIEKQHLKPFLIELLENQKQRYIEQIPNAPTLEICYEKLEAIAVEMEAAGLMRTTDVENVAWHWDLSARNIMIDRLNAEPGVPKAENHNSGGATCQAIQEEPKREHRRCVEFAIEGSSGENCEHTVRVTVENGTNAICKHNIQVVLENSSGKPCQHTLRISGEEKVAFENPIEHAIEITPCVGTRLQVPFVDSSLASKTGGEWTISGVLDWDDVLSVPLVLARKPPTWLWCNENDRSPRCLRAEGVDLDIQPARALTTDELLIKAHFDQTMARNCPTYIEDAYYRGIWLRRLACLAIYGIEGQQQCMLSESLEKDWDEYYRNTGLKDLADCASDSDLNSENSEDEGSRMRGEIERESGGESD